MSECLFCNIALGRIPADIVYQDADVLAFRDVNPQAPVHVLVIPRRHIPDFFALSDEDEGLVGKMARAAAHVAVQEGIGGTGFRSVINAGADAQQSVPHLHLHVIGGRHMTWPPG